MRCCAYATQIQPMGEHSETIQPVCYFRLSSTQNTGGINRKRRCQPACKPGSVWAQCSCERDVRDDHSSGTPVARRLKQPTRAAGLETDAGCSFLRRGCPYLVLLQVGFTLPPVSPPARCALTAPFHPYLKRRSVKGGLLSVALSLGSPPAAVSRHLVSLEPGLSSIRI